MKTIKDILRLIGFHISAFTDSFLSTKQKGIATIISKRNEGKLLFIKLDEINTGVLAVSKETYESVSITDYVNMEYCFGKKSKRLYIKKILPIKIVSMERHFQ